MLIPKEDRKKIHEYLFREGKRHPQIPNIAKNRHASQNVEIVVLRYWVS